jgi:hypothetical protein
MWGGKFSITMVFSASKLRLKRRSKKPRLDGAAVGCAVVVTAEADAGGWDGGGEPTVTEAEAVMGAGVEAEGGGAVAGGVGEPTETEAEGGAGVEGGTGVKAVPAFGGGRGGVGPVGGGGRAL